MIRLLVAVTVAQTCLCAPAQLPSELNRTAVEAPPKDDVVVKRPVHIDALPLERDGDINKDFRQEIILGLDDERDPQELDIQIRRMFSEADENGDKVLSSAELEKRIVNNTQSHLAESQQEAAAIFTSIDSDSDGQVTWDEYFPHFMTEKQLYRGEDNAVVGEDVSAKVEEEMISFKKSDLDESGALSEQEWLSFLHPEHSKESLLEMARDFMKTFDKNEDDLVSREEFSVAAPGEVEEQYRAMEEAETQRKLHEFDKDLDANKDGQATLEEFYNYINPRNPLHARREVDEVLSVADTNHDGVLSLEELLDKDWLLETSALIDANKRLHDDL